MLAGNKKQDKSDGPMVLTFEPNHGSRRLVLGGDGHNFMPFTLGSLSTLQVRGRHMLLLVQTRGESRLVAQDGNFLLRKGDWIAMGPESCPDVHQDRYGHAVGVLINADDTIEFARKRREIWTLFPSTGKITYRNLWCAKKLCVRAWRDVLTDSPFKSSQTASFANFLSFLQQDLQDKVAKCPGRSQHRRRAVFWRLQRARMFMAGNCRRNVTLGELSEIVGMSRWHLSKTFREVYGHTIRQAQAMARMEHAEMLLLDRQLSISEVSESSGYPDPCTFARTFKAHHGVSATTWRSIRTSWMPAKAGFDNRYPMLFAS